jgi:hypothetical protein
MLYEELGLQSTMADEMGHIRPQPFVPAGRPQPEVSFY